MDLCKLKDPFPSADIEWRVMQSGMKGNGDLWALVAAYVTNRAIMDRLDEVCGPAHWKNKFDPGPNGGQLCGISIKIEEEWVTKWDGSENTQIEAVKGGLSSAMKRAAVQWNIGRYLYKIDEGYAQVFLDNGGKKGAYRGVHKRKDNTKVYFTWNPPKLPAWALPKEDDGKGVAPVSEPEIKEEDKNIDQKQYKTLTAECSKHGIDPATMIKHFNVKRGSEFKVSQLDEIGKWIKDNGTVEEEKTFAKNCEAYVLSAADIVKFREHFFKQAPTKGELRAINADFSTHLDAFIEAQQAGQEAAQ